MIDKELKNLCSEDRNCDCDNCCWFDTDTCIEILKDLKEENDDNEVY